jgi:hypothetical protein
LTTVKCPTVVEIINYPDGLEERLGEGPPHLCEPCPYREGGRPIRHVEVVKHYKRPARIP